MSCHTPRQRCTPEPYLLDCSVWRIGIIDLVQWASNRFRQESNRLLSCYETVAPNTVTAKQWPGMIENVENSNRFHKVHGHPIRYHQPLEVQAVKGYLGANFPHGFPSFAGVGGNEACDSR